MAVREMVRTGTGIVEAAPTIETPEGKFTETAATELQRFMDRIVSTLNGKLTLGDGSQSSMAGNLGGQWVTFTFAAANTEYEIPHGLERVPAAVFAPVHTEDARLYYGAKVKNSAAVFLKATATGTFTFLVV